MPGIMSANPTGESVGIVDPSTLGPAESREFEFNTNNEVRPSLAERLRDSRVARVLALMASGLSLSTALAVAGCGPGNTPTGAGDGRVAVAPGEVNVGANGNIVAAFIEATPSQQESELVKLRAMSVEQINRLSPADQAAWMAFYPEDDFVSFVGLQADAMPLSFFNSSLKIPEGSTDPLYELLRGINDPDSIAGTVEGKAHTYEMCIQQAAYLLSNAGHLDEPLFKALCGASLSKNSATYAQVERLAKNHPVADGQSFDSWSGEQPRFIKPVEGTSQVKQISPDVWEISVQVTDEMGDTPRTYTLRYRYYKVNAMIDDQRQNTSATRGPLRIVPLEKTSDDVRVLGPWGFGMITGDPK